MITKPHLKNIIYITPANIVILPGNELTSRRKPYGESTTSFFTSWSSCIHFKGKRPKITAIELSSLVRKKPELKNTGVRLATVNASILYLLTDWVNFCQNSVAKHLYDSSTQHKCHIKAIGPDNKNRGIHFNLAIDIEYSENLWIFENKFFK